MRLWICTLILVLAALGCGGATGADGGLPDGGASANDASADSGTTVDAGPLFDPAELLAPGAIAYGMPGSSSAASGAGRFRFGAATASAQIEDMNTHTDWWLWTTPTAMGGLGMGTPVGEAVRGYTKAVEDVQLARELNLDSYRFSMDWSRIEPERDRVDMAALAHYDAVIDALVAANIAPMLTIHHFSSPVWVDDPRIVECPASGPSDTNLCGWAHPTGGPMIVSELASHACLLAARYGNRVDDWATLNEPVNYLLASYGTTQFPPARNYLIGGQPQKLIDAYRNYVAAHAAIYAEIKRCDTVDADGDGVAASVGLTLAVADWVPTRNRRISTNPEDVAARDRVRNVYHYLFVDSIRNGTFDAGLDGPTGDESHPDWRGKLDWLGVQYYFRAGVTGSVRVLPLVDATPCVAPLLDAGSCLRVPDSSKYIAAMGYEYWEPGIATVLLDFGQRWPGLPMIVTEAGIATESGRRRAENVVRTLEQIERARRAGVDVRGYYHWSLMDNFEWSYGFTPRFGLYRVDRTTYARTATEGATVFGEIARARSLTEAQRATYGGLGPMSPEP